jgi:hypothetical protein
MDPMTVIVIIPTNTFCGKQKTHPIARQRKESNEFKAK